MSDLTAADQAYVAARVAFDAPGETVTINELVDAADALHEAVRAHQALPHGTLEGYVDMCCRCHFCKTAAANVLTALRDAELQGG